MIKKNDELRAENTGSKERIFDRRGRRTLLIPEPPELNSVSIAGNFTESLSVIEKTNAHLHLLIGQLNYEASGESKRILVPFAELRLGSDSAISSPNEAEMALNNSTYNATVSLENMAFLVLNIMNDLRRLCEEVCLLSGGDLGPDPDRMAHVRYYVANLEKEANLCRVRLDKTYGEPKIIPSNEDSME